MPLETSVPAFGGEYTLRWTGNRDEAREHTYWLISIHKGKDSVGLAQPLSFMTDFNKRQSPILNPGIVKFASSEETSEAAIAAFREEAEAKGWKTTAVDPQGAVEKANGAGIEALANQGKIRLIWRPTTFLDGNLKNDSSSRAAAAWGCAIDAGKAAEYHNTIYANQPKEGA